MNRLALLSLCVCAAAFAQNAADLFHKAPPDVEEALVARVKGFYQAHVDGKFRQAENFVAEDTKDYFYTANKPRYFSFEIKNIKWGADFKTAEVTVVGMRTAPILGFSDKPMPIPEVSRWKIDNGQWCWYVPSNLVNMSPVGQMKSGDPTASHRPPGMPRQLPTAAEAAQLIDRVRADRTQVKMSGAPQTVTISNGLPGSIDLQLQAPKTDALTVTLKPSEVKQAQTAAVTFTPVAGKPAPKGSITITVVVKQTGQQIPIQVTF